MHIANVMVALAGDQKNVVPKTRVTAAEIAVLQAIHGNDAITEVEPLGDIKRTNREERERLFIIYGKAKDHDDRAIVTQMFPGVAARVHETLDELELAPEQFKAIKRADVTAAAVKVDLEIQDEDIAEFKLEDKTKPELLAIATGLGLAVPTTIKKSDLIALIRDAEANAPAEGEVEGDDLGDLA